MSSLDRLFDLARRTGDRLIVHNPEKGEDIVIMNVDEYESLVTDRRDVRELSGGQLLDQINRDIAIWRSHAEEEQQWERGRQLEEEVEDSRDPFADVFIRNEPWHSAADVIQDRFVEAISNEDGDEVFDFDEELDWDDEDISELESFLESDDVVLSLAEDLPMRDVEENVDETITMEEIPFEAIDDSLEEIEEKPLTDEEPVFLEEPV
ncbi:MAG: hypothetical protein ABII02_01850 [Candidatus Magasanikbacteria bacterium]